MTELSTAPDVDTGPWVSDEFGLQVVGEGVSDLVQLGLRRNPKRAHLLVSTVLGKHLPTRPAQVRSAADRLGDAVAAVLGSDGSSDGPVRDVTVLGFAETATGLGHCVAARIGAARYLHSTRRDVATAVVHGTFEEGHSHATTHLLQPASAAFLATDPTVPIVLVDDEISTGRTAIEAISALHAAHPHTRYLVASLVDMRSARHITECAQAAERLGVRIDFIALACGETVLPDGLADRVCALDATPLNPVAEVPGTVEYHVVAWPRTVPEGGRHGFLQSDTAPFHDAVADIAAGLSDRLDPDEAVTVVGHEELMYLPLCIAEELAVRGRNVRYQTTSRSPAYVCEQDGYPLRRGFTFPSPEGADESARFLYNVSAPGTLSASTVLLVIDDPADTDALRMPGGLVDVLRVAGHRVIVATIRASDPVQLAQARTRSDIGSGNVPLRGPDFGSYAPGEVAWLLKDLSACELEGAVADREHRIQSGTAHYAESLPIEFQPGAEYLELFHQALDASARRLALAVGVVTELILAESTAEGRTTIPTLVSLARAGTPVGILMRRWITHTRGLVPAHYAVSIVRGRGIDTVALDYIAERHDPTSVVFVDGWTGKGAIAQELTAALAEYSARGGVVFNDDLAVLADPGSCTRLYGTRDDFLIASACLNSTVSGLVSRTVLNDELIGPDDFHGAKFYGELAQHDLSQLFLDRVSAEFDGVVDEAKEQADSLQRADRTPTWEGWRSVERIAQQFGQSSINFVKPGIGETTRVLLRRVPWRILVREPDLDEHSHIRVLAQERGVPVQVVPDLAYSCVGLIREGQ